MSCGMHAYGEQRDDDGNWRPTHQWDADDAEWTNRIYAGQSYSLFALLAGVRNYCGIEPLFAGRGLPDDCCDEVRRAHKRMRSDAHSATWVGLWELLEHDWMATVAERGYVTRVEYDEWKAMKDVWSSPRSWCRSDPGDSGRFIYAEWSVPQWYIAREFLGSVYGQLGYYGADNARVVMWFDN